VNDTIVSVNGKPTVDRVELAREIQNYKPGTVVTLGVKRGEAAPENVQLTIPEPDMDVFVAGEPRLYGWVYNYAGDVIWIFTITFSGIATDALGVLVIILVPITMLRNLAIVASWWILAITVAELLLNPVVYYYLRAPDPEVVKMRDKGWYRGLINRVTDWNLSQSGK